MVQLDIGSVKLKPSQRKRLMSRLRRALRMGGRMADFDCAIKLERSGRQIQATAQVHDAAGDFTCRSRNPNWRQAMRLLVRTLCSRLRNQQLNQAAG